MYQSGSSTNIPTVWCKRDSSAFTVLEVTRLLHLMNVLGHRTDGTHKMVTKEITFYQDASDDNSAELQLNESRDTLTIKKTTGNVSKLPDVLKQFGLIHRE